MEVGVTGQAPPSLMDSLYRNTEGETAMSPMLHAFITRLLLRRVISLRAFSYGAIPRLLLRRQESLSAFSYGAQFVMIFRLLLRRLVSLRAFSYGA